MKGKKNFIAKKKIILREKIYNAQRGKNPSEQSEIT